MKTAIISILLTLCSSHEFYLSLTEIEHNAESKSLEISIKLFTDDLELALEGSGAPKLGIGTDDESPATNTYIESYLQNHFRLSVNGKSIDYNYLGKEAELDATWCFVEVENVKKVQTIEVENSIFIEVFDTQTNMINLFINGRKKSGLARKGNTKLVFEF